MTGRSGSPARAGGRQGAAASYPLSRYAGGAPRRRRLAAAVLLMLGAGAWAAAQPGRVRIATFNASLNRPAAGDLVRDLRTPDDRPARQIAEILQRIRPDVVLINEFDHDPAGEAVRLFRENYLAIGQNGQAPLRYPHAYAPPVNTGVTPNTPEHHPHDFNRDGERHFRVPEPGALAAAVQRYGGDAFGFGAFPGQYGFVLYSRYPIAHDEIRTFQRFLWREMPEAALPPGWYSPADLAVFRLSSKNHCDVPIDVAPGRRFHALLSHPTPPTFDGPEDRNGRRNHDEIRLWADYLSGAAYLRDDAGRGGGLPPGARFIVLGDLNADPADGDSYRGAIHLLLRHPRVDPALVPASIGGVEQARRQGGANARHRGDPAHDTGDFADTGPNRPGNLRVDYVLPSAAGWRVLGGAVFWPAEADPLFPLVEASDHRLVYLDLALEPLPTGAR